MSNEMIKEVTEVVMKAYIEHAELVESGGYDPRKAARTICKGGMKFPLASSPVSLDCATCRYRHKDDDVHDYCGRLYDYPQIREDEKLLEQYKEASPLMCWTPHDEAIARLGDDMPAVFRHPERQWWGDAIMLMNHYGELTSKLNGRLPVALTEKADGTGELWTTVDK